MEFVVIPGYEDGISMPSINYSENRSYSNKSPCKFANLASELGRSTKLGLFLAPESDSTVIFVELPRMFSRGVECMLVFRACPRIWRPSDAGWDGARRDVRHAPDKRFLGKDHAVTSKR